MPSLDWSQCPAVESIPGKVSGAWVFRDTRLPVATVIENLEDMSVEEVMEQFDVTRANFSSTQFCGAEPEVVSSGTGLRSPRCSFSLKYGNTGQVRRSCNSVRVSLTVFQARFPLMVKGRSQLE